MPNMEFLKANLYNTTSSIVGSTGTGTFGNLFDNSRSLGYATVGHSSDTATNITVSFTSAIVMSKVLILNHNLRNFRVFYDGATANSWANVSNNSATSTYISFASTTVSSFTVQLSLTQAADTEKRIGELVATEARLSFTVNPPHDGYKPERMRTKVVHKMPDGGVTMFQIKNKFKAKIKLEFISTAFMSSLSQVFDEADPLWFVPFPTTAVSWDGIAHEVLWTNDFDFTYADNSRSQGWNGEIEVMETPGAGS